LVIFGDFWHFWAYFRLLFLGSPTATIFKQSVSYLRKKSQKKGQKSILSNVLSVKTAIFHKKIIEKYIKKEKIAKKRDKKHKFNQFCIFLKRKSLRKKNPNFEKKAKKKV
jgi:hypothetical protein